ncbi:hypothetical protein DMA11_13870 [Marinilabiliaceae bacterium JC017]|nr:hypothetical protein DMA11_13870 [Marinilabiliaceae bacterium JC017]
MPIIPVRVYKPHRITKPLRWRRFKIHAVTSAHHKWSNNAPGREFKSSIPGKQIFGWVIVKPSGFENLKVYKHQQ